MLYTTNIDMYKDGYSTKMYDCINIPIGASLGNYDRENYFYFGLLMTIKYNWTLANEQYGEDCSWYEKCCEVAERIGYKVKAYEIKTEEAFYDYIKKKMKENTPVMVCVKYKNVFYHRYYMDKVGDDNHMYIVDKWNSDKEIFSVRDSTFLAYRGVMESDTDILFPINLKEDMLLQMWKDSCEEENNTYNKYLYVVEKKEKEQTFDYKDAFHELFHQSQKEESLFARHIKNFNQYRESFREVAEVLNKRYVGTIRGLIVTIEHWMSHCGVRLNDMEQWNKQSQNYIAEREMIFNKLFKCAMRRIDLEEAEIEMLVEEVRRADGEFLSYFAKIVKSHYEEEKRGEIIKLDISGYFNNSGIDCCPERSCEADISGNGIFFVLDQEVIQAADHKWKECFHVHSFFHSKPSFDNISCEGQFIQVHHDTYKKIHLLACSEYGSYEERIELYRDEECVQSITFSVSDFYQEPIYNEELFCTGDTYQQFTNGIQKLDFSARIFEYSFSIEAGEIHAIKLPVRRNIHIFAISFSR